MTTKTKGREWETVHFLVEGDFITDLARDIVREGNYAKALDMVQCFDGLDNGQCIAILAGKLRMSGWGICQDPKCKQCKGKEPLHLVDDDVEIASLQEAFKSLQDEIETLKRDKYELIRLYNGGGREDAYEFAKETTKALIKPAVDFMVGKPVCPPDHTPLIEIEDEEEEEEKFIESDPIDLESGWLGPNGGWYSCEYWGHTETSFEITRKFGYDVASDGPDSLLDRGWIKVGRYMLGKHIVLIHYGTRHRITNRQIDKLWDWYQKHKIKFFEWNGTKTTYQNWLKKMDDESAFI